MHVRLIIHNKIDTKNDIINVIITALSFLVLMYCVYKLYQNPIPGNDLNIALIVSFFVRAMRFSTIPLGVHI